MNRRLPATRPWWILIWLTTAVVSLAWILFSRQATAPTQATNQLPIAPTAGSFAPDFTLTTLEGETITLHDLRGTAVVLNFWASWCGPCRYETPFFQQIHEARGDEVLILGLNQRETPATVADFGAEFGVTYPLLLDSEGRVGTAYRVFGLPTTVLVDGEGVVREVLPGAVSTAVLGARIEALLAQPPH